MKQQQKEYEFNELYLKLDQYCQYIAQDKWEKEDLIQETFLKAMNKYESRELTPALLKKIANNQRLDWIRKKKELPQLLTNESSTIHELLPKMVVAEHLADNLTFKQGTVYMLVEGFQFQLKEAAQCLMITETAVKSILFRARNQLRKLGSQVNEEDQSDTSNISSLYYKVLKQEDPRELITEYVKKYQAKQPYAKQSVMLMAA
ncbi:sigma factor [Bacillus sp. B1-b2]|uniref:sigma factor n=1 Tax=Bacillus sp. B1-b2 TaxID=2653201 RepID=UPI00186984A9|nr:sigma factor [Bacillus sp. B1-b2]